MILALLLLLLQTTTAVTIVLDDDHPATAGITGYKWVMDGKTASMKVKMPTPCLSCLERTYTLAVGMHALRVVPYTAKGDLTADAKDIEIVVEIAGSESERRILITMAPK